MFIVRVVRVVSIVPKAHKTNALRVLRISDKAFIGCLFVSCKTAYLKNVFYV